MTVLLEVGYTSGRVQAEGDNFCDLKILYIYFFNVKLGHVG